MGPFSKKPSEPQANRADSTRVDPAHETLPSTSAQQPVVRKERHSKSFSFVSVLFLLMLLVAGVMTYLWYNQTADIDTLNREIAQLQSEHGTLKKQDTTAPTGGSDLKTESMLGSLTESYHQANVTETYQNTPYIVKIKYLDKDQTFARVHVEYVSSDQNLPKNTLTGKFDHYIFKNVTKKNGDKEWVMLAKNPILEDARTNLKNMYGVPSDVMDLTKEQPA